MRKRLDNKSAQTDVIREHPLKNARSLIIYCIYALVFSGVCLFGLRHVSQESIPFFSYFIYFPLLFFMGIFLLFLADKVCLVMSSKESISIRANQKLFHKLWFILFLLLFSVSLIGWLALWPGIYTDDSMTSLSQGLGISTYTTHHPPAFTFIMSIFIGFGNALENVECGMALFSFVTMLVATITYSYTCVRILYETRSCSLFVFSLIFLGLNPVVVIYNVTAWKDIWFSVVMLLFILALIELVKSPGRFLQMKGGVIRLCILALLASLFRSNGIYVVIPTLFVIAVLFRNFNKKLVYGGTAVLVSYFLITGPFFTLLGVQPGRPSEPLGVPLQQIARTIVDEGHLSAEDAEFLQKMFDFDDIKQKYKPYIVDPIKGCSSFDNDFLSANKIEFVKTWIHIAVDNPRSYFNAWCDITLGYWYLGAEDWIIAEKGYTENNSAIGSDSVNWGQSPNSEGTPLIGSSVSPANYVEVFNQFRGLLILPIYNIAFLVWFAFAIFVVCIHRRQYMYIIPLFPLFFLWLTMLVAAPTFCEFRYMYVFHLSVPLLCMISIMTRSNKSLEKLSK